MNADFVFNLEKLLKCKTDGIQKINREPQSSVVYF
jgi:hypothetical protein